MQPELKIEITAKPKSDEEKYIRQQINQFNQHCAGEENYQHLAVFLRDCDRLVGGLVGYTYWQWLYVDVFWIQESYRKGGYGSAMLAAAEAEAIQRGCHSVYLGTYSFQAPEFYQKLGYAVFGELPNFPEGQSLFFLTKTL
ncbi:MAG: GNAT family N-acetyltransferase [Leptolyngbyaceae cyanobacterium SM1_3_5]|nr:GNAT family N-acetyltransferase [Leptolyngbyaceae cyanobacterium SM1_3_5]